MPVVATPCTKCFWQSAKIIRHGNNDITDIANIAPQSDCELESKNKRSPRGTVYNC